jgi:hypothetical protein
MANFMPPSAAAAFQKSELGGFNTGNATHVIA